MVHTHTHALLPQGFFGRRTYLVKQSSDMVYWSRIEYQNACQRQNELPKFEYIKDSEAKGENGQDLVRNVRDVLEVARLNVLGQSVCRNGEMA